MRMPGLLLLCLSLVAACSGPERDNKLDPKSSLYTEPPEILPPPEGDFVINNGSGYTTSQEIFLHLEFSRSVEYFQASLAADFSGSTWEEIVQEKKIILPQEGIYNIYVRFQSGEGEFSDTMVRSVKVHKNSWLNLSQINLGSVEVSWQTLFSTTSSRIQYSYDDSFSNDSGILPTGNNTFVINNLLPGRTLNVRLVQSGIAEDDDELAETASLELSIWTTNITATIASPDSWNISWGQLDGNEGYVVYWGQDSSNLSNNSGNLAAGMNSYTIGGLEFDRTYYYSISPVVSGQADFYSSVQSFTTEVCHHDPLSDENINCSAPNYVNNGDGTISDDANGLTWTRCPLRFEDPPSFPRTLPLDLEEILALDTTDPNVCTLDYTFSLNFFEAVLECEALNELNGGTGFAGRSDWQVPDKSQMYTMASEWDAASFPQISYGNYWSGSLSGTTGWIWRMDRNTTSCEVSKSELTNDCSWPNGLGLTGLQIAHCVALGLP
jgi:hypothetical protein